MKTVYAILIAFTLQTLFAAGNVYAQTVAVGHVSAEVVEAVSVSSQAVTGFQINPAADLSYRNLKLGEIKINSGSSIACNIVLKSATLSGNNGTSITIEPSVNSSVQADPQRADGDQTIRLTGNAHMTPGQASGLYHGSYTINFVYN